MNGHDLPLVNACLNGLSTLLLIAGFLQIKKGNVQAHQKCMLSALVTSALFLVGYLVHKIVIVKGVNTPFAGPEALRIPYLVMLATHVFLAMFIVPLAGVTIFRGFKGQNERHKKIARWTWPLWMYVSVTGVLIYLVLYQIWPSRPH